jgi:hypothetical protein
MNSTGWRAINRAEPAHRLIIDLAGSGWLGYAIPHTGQMDDVQEEHGINKADLVDGCEIIPAGILELIRLQEAGYAYIKP